MKNQINVMWLEENLFVIDKFKAQAQEFDIMLQTFNCWDDAYNALVSNIKGWDAIILDPNCKLGRGDRPKPQHFLPQVFCDLASLCTKYDIVMPWYVFTDLNPTIFEDIIVKDRLRYDAEWEQPYYSMKDDANQLFCRIKMQVSSIDRTKIREGVHKDLFDKLSALTSFGLVREDVLTMEDILISLYENKESKRCNFINIRKLIENLIRSMVHYGLLPNDIRNTMGNINFVGCARLLAGLECNSDTWQYKPLTPIISHVAGNNVLSILNICHGYAHSIGSSQTHSRKDTNQYLESVQTNNLLHASALMLADVVIMYCNFLQQHATKDATNNVYWTKTNISKV